MIPLFAVLLLIFSSVVQANNYPSWYFDVYLGSEKIGEHHFELKQKDGVEVVNINAMFKTRILLFFSYEYQHQNRELWRNGCLQKLNSSTNDNGDRFKVDSSKQKNQYQLMVNDKGSMIYGDCVKTFAYWDDSILQSKQLLNAQSGEYMLIEVIDLGISPLQLRGVSINANHYQIKTSDFIISLWYDDTGQWLGLESMTNTGSKLRYQLR